MTPNVFAKVVEALDYLCALEREVGSARERTRAAEIRHVHARRGEKRGPASELRTRQNELSIAEAHAASAKVALLALLGQQRKINLDFCRGKDDTVLMTTTNNTNLATLQTLVRMTSTTMELTDQVAKLTTTTPDSLRDALKGCGYHFVSAGWADSARTEAIFEVWLVNFEV